MICFSSFILLNTCLNIFWQFFLRIKVYPSVHALEVARCQHCCWRWILHSRLSRLHYNTMASSASRPTPEQLGGHASAQPHPNHANTSAQRHAALARQAKGMGNPDPETMQFKQHPAASVVPSCLCTAVNTLLIKHTGVHCPAQHSCTCTSTRRHCRHVAPLQLR